MIKFTLPSILCFMLPLLALGATQSDTVPTSQLLAAFQVMPATANVSQVRALVTLTHVIIANGKETDEALDQSSDDVVSFSVGQNSVTYNPSAPDTNVLPYVAGATYTFAFKRFNGESYSGSVVMPAVTTLTAPAQNEVFKTTDAVNLAWNSIAAQEGLFIMDTNCRSFDSSGLSYNADYTAALIPAGAASGCPAAVQVQFSAIYANGGTGFGSFVAASFGGVSFSYGTTASTEMALSLRGVPIDRLLAEARLSGNRTVKMNF